VQPVVVHISQGTDWWATLLGGLIGAVIGTLGAFGAAFLLIRAQRNADQAQRAADREQAAQERRLDLVNRALDTLTDMQAQLFVHTSDPNNFSGHLRALDYISGRWQRLQAIAVQLDLDELGRDAREIGNKASRIGVEEPPELLDMAGACWSIIEKALNELLEYAKQLVRDGASSALQAGV
jgi:hypothetical protein